MIWFKLEDITFFKKNVRGQLCCLPHSAPDSLVLTADGAAKNYNQKNGRKGVCIYQECNGDSYMCLVQALGHWVVNFRQAGAAGTTLLSPFWVGEKKMMRQQKISVAH